MITGNNFSQEAFKIDALTAMKSSVEIVSSILYDDCYNHIGARINFAQMQMVKCLLSITSIETFPVSLQIKTLPESFLFKLEICNAKLML